MSVVIRSRHEAMGNIDMCKSLGQFVEQFWGRVGGVGFVDGNEGRIVAHYRSATDQNDPLTIVTQL